MRKTIRLVASLLVLGFATGGFAQTTPDQPANLRGIVRADDGQVVSQATVVLDDIPTVIRTEQNGTFFLPDVKAGRHKLGVRAVGFEAATQSVLLTAGRDLNVTFTLKRITTLETSKIVGISVAHAEFDDRRARKLGYAIDSTVLNNRADLMSALSRIPLTSVSRNRSFGLRITVRSLSGGGNCVPNAFLDGKMTDLASVTELPPDHFRAIEVLPYETVPGKYASKPCVGAILFWSKNAKW
ncbi:MAG: carboxypeptidase-like regulatory domain-containing protein [Gemmatimonadaceae bacterium]